MACELCDGAPVAAEDRILSKADADRVLTMLLTELKDLEWRELVEQKLRHHYDEQAPRHRAPSRIEAWKMRIRAALPTPASEWLSLDELEQQLLVIQK